MLQIENKIQEKRAIDILEKAFYNSPGVIWILGHNRKHLRLLLSMFLLEAKLRDGAFISSDHNGVVLFFKLKKKFFSTKLLFKKLYVFLFVIGVSKGLKAIAYKRMVEDIRPKSGWLGWFVATESCTEGNQAAYHIKKWMFACSDLSNEPIYLETTSARAMELYKKAGYIEYYKMKHPYQDISVWFMKRNPGVDRETTITSEQDLKRDFVLY